MQVSHHYPLDARLYFHSDVHLSPKKPELAQRYLSHLSSIPADADAVYILGDLFDYWLGPESHLDFIETLYEIKAFAKKTQVYFIRGNRDFLLSDNELLSWGIQPLPDPCLIQHGDSRILLTHGDLLCTLDHAYQRFRSVIRHPLTTSSLLSVPLAWRLYFIQFLRRISQSQNQVKSYTIMHANPETIARWMKYHQAKALIYGHVHVLAYANASSYYRLHSCDLTNQSTYQGAILNDGCHCFTLDCWDKSTNFLLIRETGYYLQPLRVL